MTDWASVLALHEEAPTARQRAIIDITCPRHRGEPLVRFTVLAYGSARNPAHYLISGPQSPGLSQRRVGYMGTQEERDTAPALLSFADIPALGDDEQHTLYYIECPACPAEKRIRHEIRSDKLRAFLVPLFAKIWAYGRRSHLVVHDLDAARRADRSG